VGCLGSEGVVGRLGFRVGVSASYSYFRVSWIITTLSFVKNFHGK